MEIKYPPIEVQQEIATQLEQAHAENRKLKIEICGLTDENLARYGRGYEKPDAVVLRAIVSKIGLTRSEIAGYLGIKTRQVRRYLAEPPEVDMPYGAVRMLLHKLGVIDASKLGVPNSLVVPENCIKPFSDEEYRPPTGEELKHFQSAVGLSVFDAAEMLGVSDRTIKKWRSGERPVSNGAWRLLLIEYGLVIP